jgi:hypothetical protein
MTGSAENWFLASPFREAHNIPREEPQPQRELRQMIGQKGGEEIPSDEIINHFWDEDLSPLLGWDSFRETKKIFLSHRPRDKTRETTLALTSKQIKREAKNARKINFFSRSHEAHTRIINSLITLCIFPYIKYQRHFHKT